ncbi:MAG: hypothetical protein ABII64_06050 [Elusimicrobiota bacterium]
MKCSRVFFFCFAGLVLLTKGLYAEVKVTPIANIDLMGGQYWVTGASPDKLSANLDIFFCPVLNFSPRTALLPIYTGLYSGTKDVKELIGGGTLTREMQDHSISLKFVHKLNDAWKLKSRVGYKIEYLKETVDETWGKGLFDFKKMIIGAEAEKSWETWNGRVGIDYYTMNYPNYQSLVSQTAFQTSLDTTTYTEISTQAGKDVLDYNTMSLFLEAKHKFSANLYGTAHNDISIKSFKDQKIVKNTGEFSPDLRSDLVNYLTFGIRVVGPKAVLGITDGIQYYKSNQSSYDAANSKFIADYYNYTQNSVMPSITFTLGSGDLPMSLTLYWDITYRAYASRPAQSDDGTYKSENINQTTNTFGMNFTYPIIKSVSAKFSTNYRDSSSNMKYEKNYKYNYYTFNYFVGMNWQL